MVIYYCRYSNSKNREKAGGGGVVTSSLQQGSSQPCTLGRADGGGWVPTCHPAV